MIRRKVGVIKTTPCYSTQAHEAVSSPELLYDEQTFKSLPTVKARFGPGRHRHHRYQPSGLTSGFTEEKPGSIGIYSDNTVLEHRKTWLHRVIKVK